MKKAYVSLILFAAIVFFSCEDLLLGPEPQDNPKNNFNLLWNEFDKYYPSFITKGINWDSLYAVYFNMITDDTRSEDLWHIFFNLFQNFNDPHVYMYNYNQSDFIPSCRSCYAHDDEFSLQLVKQSYLRGSYKIAGDGNFTYGRFPGDSIGYIHIASFDGSGAWESDIDGIVAELHDVKALIIDLRDNGGGNVLKAEGIAGAFTSERITYSKEIARNGPEHYNFTDPVYHTLQPRSTAYTGKNVLLTNKNSSSASEVFALIFSHMSYSTQIGDSTAGGLGVTPKMYQLLNGWTYCMPASVFLTTDGRSLEGIGVVPDFWIRNKRAEISSGYDKILEYTLEYLNN